MSVIVTDFNKDGIPDLAVDGSVPGYVSILFGKGNGTFQPHVDYLSSDPAGRFPYTVAAADLTANRVLDLAVPELN